MKTKKKRVKFADNVMEAREMREEVRGKQRKQNRVSSNCRHETLEHRRMPANRITLYNGILRDKVHKMGYSY
ncbi:hypothetical protein EI012_26955 [Escherichia coli]|nr:hypothetical protein [Escherichia coli]